MGTLLEKPVSMADLRPGKSITFEFGSFLFGAVIEDTSRLEEDDELLVTVYSASAPQGEGGLPIQVWLRGASHYLIGHRMRLASG